MLTFNLYALEDHEPVPRHLGSFSWCNLHQVIGVHKLEAQGPRPYESFHEWTVSVFNMRELTLSYTIQMVSINIS